MSEFVQLKSPYKINDINLDRIATKEHHRKNKLIVKIYYKPNRSRHTDFLFQTPEILLKKSIKYNNKKGNYELNIPFLGKKQTQIDKFLEFIVDLEKKVIEIIKKHKEWFSNNNINFKSILRYPDSKDDLYKYIRLKIDSDTLITKKGSNIDLNNLQKDFYVKCILKVSFIYVKDSFATINIYPKLIDLRDKKEDLKFASESENESSIDSNELTTESEENNDENNKTSSINVNENENKNDNLDHNLETLKQIESSTIEIPSEIRDNCGTKDMFNSNLEEHNNEKEIIEEGIVVEDMNQSKQELDLNSSSNNESNQILSEDDNNNELSINNNLDTDTSIMSNINNSENILETYNNMRITNIDFNSEESDDGSEEIDQDEISRFESELLSKG